MHPSFYSLPALAIYSLQCQWFDELKAELYMWYKHKYGHIVCCCHIIYFLAKLCHHDVAWMMMRNFTCGLAVTWSCRECLLSLCHCVSVHLWLCVLCIFVCLWLSCTRKVTHKLNCTSAAVGVCALLVFAGVTWHTLKCVAALVPVCVCAFVC